MTTTTTASVRQQPESANWGLVLVQGIALLLVGTALIVSPSMSLTVLVAFLGFYWLVGGVLDLVRLFTREGRAHWALNLIGGVLGIIAGLVVLRHPLWSAALVPTLLVIILGINALVMGFVSIVRAFTGDGFWAGLLGAINIVLGIVLLGSPLVAASVFTVILGTFSVIAGIVLIPTALSIRRHDREAAVPPQQVRRAA